MSGAADAAAAFQPRRVRRGALLITSNCAPPPVLTFLIMPLASLVLLLFPPPLHTRPRFDMNSADLPQNWRPDVAFFFFSSPPYQDGVSRLWELKSGLWEKHVHVLQVCIGSLIWDGVGGGAA